MPTFDHATWLAARATQVPAGGLPEPARVTLPGAREPIEADLLHAHQELGRDPHDIVRRINEGWEARNAEVIAEHAAWASGPYHSAIAELQRQDQIARAEQARRQALIELRTREAS